MYSNNELGQVSSGVSTVVSTVASTAVRTIASMIPAVSSFAGPIGMVVGALVSLFMALFGAKAKTPAYGLSIVVPAGKKPTFGMILGFLQKPIYSNHLSMWGVHDYTKLAQYAERTKALLLAPPMPGFIHLDSGGTPDAVLADIHANWNSINASVSNRAQPYFNLVSHILDPVIKLDVLNTDLSLVPSKSYYYNLDKSSGAPLNIPLKYQTKANYDASWIKKDWDEFAVATGYQNLDKALTKSFNKFFGDLNKVIADKLGVDAQTGTIINQALADKAFNPAVASTAPPPGGGTVVVPGGSGSGTISLPVIEAGGMNLTPLLLIGGLVYLAK